MEHQHRECDRRRNARVRERGRVAIHGRGYGRGKILDISVSGVAIRIAGPADGYRLDDQLDLELRFDGAMGGWWRMSGHIVRHDGHGQLAVAFDDLPTDFEDWIQSALVAALDAEPVTHVLLVDPIALHRGPVAASMRTAGYDVREVATPLDAIDRLGESRDFTQIVAIADTVPAGIADDLRAYVRAEHTDLGLVRILAAS